MRDIQDGSWELVTSLSGRRAYRPGSIVRYSCEQGYTLYGPVERICQSNGTWSDSSPSCHANGLYTLLVSTNITTTTTTTNATTTVLSVFV